jgi:hypothetical protein
MIPIRFGAAKIFVAVPQLNKMQVLKGVLQCWHGKTCWNSPISYLESDHFSCLRFAGHPFWVCRIDEDKCFHCCSLRPDYSQLLFQLDLKNSGPVSATCGSLPFHLHRLSLLYGQPWRFVGWRNISYSLSFSPVFALWATVKTHHLPGHLVLGRKKKMLRHLNVSRTQSRLRLASVQRRV